VWRNCALYFLLVFGIAVVPLSTAFAQPAPSGEKSPPAAGKKPAPIPPETTSTTSHELTLGGKKLMYTATAGTLLINGDDDKPYGSIFYVAYTLDGAGDPGTRPLTFFYNGGPGSASLWLHMGSVGPVRVVTASPSATGAAPYKVVPNEYSLLDRSDLVFIDAPCTGYSRAVGSATLKNFAGVDQDATAFARFIERYISVNQRWSSPKFLFGESYGTTRSAVLADMLQAKGISLNGVILLSSILNFFIRAPGGDQVYVGYLPSYAAIAWHFEKVPRKGRDEKAFLDEVRAFARGPYVEALAQGHNLPPAQVDAMAAKVAAYTGISIEYLKEANLRVSPSRFRKELLRGQRLILGRYDARFEGTDEDAAGETPGYDPSSTGIIGAFVASLHDYFERELKYTSKDTYYPSGPHVNEQWDHSHRQGGAPSERPQGLRGPYVAGDLADAMRKNPRMKVLSMNGLFDLATPFFLTEYTLSHMQLEPKLRGNVEFTYYHSGHMVYLNIDELKRMKTDLDGFYARVAEAGR